MCGEGEVCVVVTGMRNSLLIYLSYPNGKPAGITCRNVVYMCLCKLQGTNSGDRIELFRICII